MKSLAGRRGGLAMGHSQRRAPSFRPPSSLPPGTRTVPGMHGPGWELRAAGGRVDTQEPVSSSTGGCYPWPDGPPVLSWSAPLAAGPPSPTLTASPARSRPPSRPLRPPPRHAPRQVTRSRRSLCCRHSAGAPCTSLGGRPVEKTEQR